MKKRATNFVQRIRQNHAVEHATISVLMYRNRHLRLVGGRSNGRGFYVFGAVDTPLLQSAAQEALTRLQNGEAELAIHPNCGTNLVASGVLAGLAAFVTTTIGRRRHASALEQLPMTILAGMVALVVGRPVGTQLQRHVTTTADVRQLRLGAITRRQFGRWVLHFVHLHELR